MHVLQRRLRRPSAIGLLVQAGWSTAAFGGTAEAGSPSARECPARVPRDTGSATYEILNPFSLGWLSPNEGAMDIEVTFPGGKRVNAEVGRFQVKTDQPSELGGAESAPAPYDLFLASLATCAGIYVLGFCQARGISTQGLRLTQRHEYDPQTKLVSRVRIDLHLPADFPEKYRASIVRTAEGCKVKKTLAAPPIFEVELASDPGVVPATHHEEVACASE
jgi:ribosomal protein S12 methylthiotransferase accessory factor